MCTIGPFCNKNNWNGRSNTTNELCTSTKHLLLHVHEISPAKLVGLVYGRVNRLCLFESETKFQIHKTNVRYIAHWMPVGWNMKFDFWSCLVATWSPSSTMPKEAPLPWLIIIITSLQNRRWSVKDQLRPPFRNCSLFDSKTFYY